tara:strand:+ start:267 stop:812 length:546 start_codon:yes stop_codon:yes gene_type:complete
MSLSHHISGQILIFGHRATGKSTVGKILSKRFSCPFVDLDEVVCQNLGYLDVFSAWENITEADWREAESVALLKALQTKPAVIACGGGILEGDSSYKAIHKSEAMQIVLWASLPTLESRRKGDRRPLLAVSLKEELENTLPKRVCRLKSLNSIDFQTDAISPEELANKIVKTIKAKSTYKG